MQINRGLLAIIVVSFGVPSLDGQTPAEGGVVSVALYVPTGAPLRLYLTGR